jgi:hypothetical protein
MLMKNLLLALAWALLPCCLLQAQAFRFELWFEDAAGQRDTIALGYDDEATWGIDPQFGEVDIKSHPLGDSLEVRLAYYEYGTLGCDETMFDPTLFHTKTRIYPGECAATFEEEASMIIIVNAVFPLRMSWDRSLFQDSCRNQSFVTDWLPGGWFDAGCSLNDIIFLSEREEFMLTPADEYYMATPSDTAYMYFMAFRGDAHVGSNTRSPYYRTEISLFPNPSSDKAYASLPPGETLNFLLFDAQGRQRAAGLARQGEALPLPPNLADGWYFFHFFRWDGSPQGYGRWLLTRSGP